MKQFFENKNACDIFMNDIRMEDEPLLELEENGNVQIEGNRNPKTSEKKMNEISRKLHAQIFWEPNNKNALRWAFYCVNDNKEIDLIRFQMMNCIFSHNSIEFKSKNSSYENVDQSQHN
jgi:hypothetical protein